MLLDGIEGDDELICDGQICVRLPGPARSRSRARQAAALTIWTDSTNGRAGGRCARSAQGGAEKGEDGCWKPGTVAGAHARPLHRAAGGGASSLRMAATSAREGGPLVALSRRSPTADQPVAAPARVAVPGQDVLLATKVHVPGLQPGFVPRPRLAEALGEGLARQLILDCAPAGFGKTAVLADWAARWTTDRGLAADDEPDYPGSRDICCWPGCCWPGQALALLNRLHAAEVTQDRTGSLIEIGALRALALAAPHPGAGGAWSGQAGASDYGVTPGPCTAGLVPAAAHLGNGSPARPGRLAWQRLGFPVMSLAAAAPRVPIQPRLPVPRSSHPGRMTPSCQPPPRKIPPHAPFRVTARPGSRS